MKRSPLPLAAIFIASLVIARATNAQSEHTPLAGIEVRLESLGVSGAADSIDTSTSAHFELHATTDAEGKFVFGYVPPGIYALGCSYRSCSIAFRKAKAPATKRISAEGANDTSEAPIIRLSVDACEGMVCRVAVATMTPDDWPSNSALSTATTITKNWNNSARWLKSGGGVTLRIDGARSVISGKIEVE